ncbi:MAG: general secretion pathway protein GspK [Gemmatimonadota bacterium]|jgi:general secretion pathway protein K|nr:general secretion pathway protein GspK [Gemmatimonadota bacterium]
MKRGSAWAAAGVSVRSRVGRAGPGSEEGFALLAVLWIVAAMAGLGLLASLAGREAIGAANNRAALARAAWRAADCVERARAAADVALKADRITFDAPDPWNELDRTIPSSRLLAGVDCEIRIVPSGTTLDVNTAGTPLLLRALRANGVTEQRADSMLAALLDWIDPDEIRRESGAERQDYLPLGRPLPRNGRLADIRELSRIRGWAGDDRLLRTFGVDSIRVSLNHAPAEVLAALPGFTGETVSRIIENRMMGRPLTSLEMLGAELSEGSRDSLNAHYFELRQLTVTSPEFWIITGGAREGAPAVEAWLEVTLARSGDRAAIIRRRSGVS